MTRNGIEASGRDVKQARSRSDESPVAACGGDAPNTRRMTNPPTILVSDAMIEAGRKASHWATVQLERDEFEAIYLAMKAQEQASDHSPDEVERRVPLKPTEAMWGGLARDIMMWMDFADHTPRALFKHLKRLGRTIPDWLTDEAEMKSLDHVPSKGTRCAIIYRAMIEEAPVLSTNEVLQPSSAMVERVRELEKVVGVFADALDMADGIIGEACGTDTPRSWDRAYRKCGASRQALTGGRS